MQLSRLPGAPPNLLADPLGIMSQENKGDKPGQKLFSALGICSKSVCKLFGSQSCSAPSCTGSARGVCQDSVGQCDYFP